MVRSLRGGKAVLLAACLTTASAAAPSLQPAPRCILRIALPSTATAPASGRLLLFAVPAPAGTLPDSIDADPMQAAAVTVAAQDIAFLPPGTTAYVDADTQAYPAGFSQLKPGDYAMQAVLDTQRNYAYAGRVEGDLTSDVVRVTVTACAAAPPLQLAHLVPQRDPWQLPPRAAALRAIVEAAKPHAAPFEFQSPVLSKFWGRPITLRGWVLKPPGYDADHATSYPATYYIHGFGGSYFSLTRPLGYIDNAMVHGEMPPMLWVFLDESSPTGTHEFADSVNNGPWGAALTSELIPELERLYRIDTNPKSRFLTGHSSGGWASLWLQTQYPALFGGTWSTAPDPSDFHDFTGVDIYATGVNMYRRPDGTPTPLVRIGGKPVETIQQFAQLEEVLGPSGGIFSSFNWVFSPRGPDGRPLPLFNRGDGAVDPAIAAYWGAHYDIAHLVAANWARDGRNLIGKINVVVGDSDTFYLDGPAHRLEKTLDRLHAGAHFTYVPGRGHFDLYRIGNDDFGLVKRFAAQMYAIARPGATAR